MQTYGLQDKEKLTYYALHWPSKMIQDSLHDHVQIFYALSAEHSSVSSININHPSLTAITSRHKPLFASGNRVQAQLDILSGPSTTVDKVPFFSTGSNRNAWVELYLGTPIALTWGSPFVHCIAENRISERNFPLRIPLLLEGKCRPHKLAWLTWIHVRDINSPSSYLVLGYSHKNWVWHAVKTGIASTPGEKFLWPWQPSAKTNGTQLWLPSVSSSNHVPSPAHSGLTEWNNQTIP